MPKQHHYLLFNYIRSYYEKIIKAFIATGLAVATFSVQAVVEDRFVTIGTGGNRVYYVVGQSICQLVNRDTAKTHIKCNAPSTGASVANLNAIAAQEMEMGIVQSDWQYHSYNGTSTFKNKKT